MRVRLVLVLLALLAVAPSSPRPALAGIIDVGGTLAVPGVGGPNVNLVGSDRGFTVSAFTDEVNASVGPFGCRPCLPADPISVNVVAGGLSVVGHATLDGKTYGLGGVESPGNLDLFFSGPHLFAPPLNVAPIVALTSPLDFSGVFIHVDDPSQPTLTESLVSEGLGATATVTVEIRRLPTRALIRL